ncbi:hypothetical protein CWR41_22525 [Cedecea lapagei]|nr:hypothetical protein CWR41_22525 [Cedecea lapagei]
MSNDLVLTVAGAAAIEAAYTAGEVVTITVVQIGDGGGAPVTADPATEALAGMFGSEPFSAGSNDGYMISGTAVIPAKSYPGKVIRELGLMSREGILIAYGSYPDTYLPEQNDSIVKQIVIDFMMPLVHAECVTLEIDPNVAVITQEEGDKRYLRQALRLQEIADQGEEAQAQAREHLALGSAATHDVTTSHTDTTAGRVLQVGDGGLLGATQFTMGTTSQFLAYASAELGEVPSNGAGWQSAYAANRRAQVFIGGDRFYSRFTTSDVVLDTETTWAIHYTTKYKPTAADVGALPSTGGKLTGNLEIADGAPLLTLTDTDNNNKKYILVNDGGDIRLDEDSTAGNNVWKWSSSTNVLSVNGEIAPTVWTNFDARYYTQSAANAKFITGVRQGTEGSQGTHDSLATSKAPSGCVLTGIKSNYNDGNWEVDTIYFRPEQIQLNGNWINTGYSTALLTTPAHIKSPPKSGVSSLLNLRPCLSEAVTDNDGNIIPGAADYVDENGYLWSVASQALTGSIFIAVDDAGVIRQIDADATMLRPDGLSVYGLDALPDGFETDSKSWKFGDEGIWQDVAVLTSAAQRNNLRRYLRLRSEAASEIVMLQSCAETGRGRPDDEARIQVLRTYLADLRETDLTAAEPGWPALP